MRGFKDWRGEIEGVPWYKFKLMLHLHYYDLGMGKLAIIKYFWLLGGFGSIVAGVNYIYTLLAGALFVIACYVFGWIYYNWGWLEAATEVSNQINPFVKQMRKVYKR